ncbi:mycothiol-dependent maleylpyruvate isomerase [Arthrobacter saudimassiliensis]|uniref:Mycothiol-dependent maleylpyruvate isomerase n=1 Tax=Arthrobacter saudimassiliensis TaxID=1461584 RepID=A0A078MSB6_9MICC|nr:mycothiol-dependent maleylpyruvate isomerase [Arthrobacter saudimassiliensis]
MSEPTSVPSPADRSNAADSGLPHSAGAGAGSSEPDTSRLLEFLDQAAEDFHRHAAALTDSEVRAPSLLPGWSRGHVLAHVAGVAHGMARQLEYAADGRRIELYDGGAEGRNAAIEADAVLPAEDLHTRVAAGLDRARAAFHRLDDAAWNAPISYRDGTVKTGGLALWRELAIHAVDLGSGPEPDGWSQELCAHLFDFLAARVPEGLRLRLEPAGMDPLVLTHPASPAPFNTVTVRGIASDIAAWLAGRTPTLGSLEVDGGGGLPELLPWPSALAR